MKTSFRGNKGEDSWTSDLADELKRLGLKASCFPIFHYIQDGQRKTSKPDIEIMNGGICIGSAKLGEQLIAQAIGTAQEYSIILQNVEELKELKIKETLAITYPCNKSEKFHLFALARPGRPVIKIFVAETLTELAQKIFSIVNGEEEKILEASVVDTAPRMLYYGARDLALTIKKIDTTALEEVFGGHHFFQNILASRLKGKERDETLRLGVAFLFVNQIFFYVLLSKSAEESGDKERYPPISDVDMGNPQKLQDYYFKKVRDLNYEPIYGLPVALFFTHKEALESCKNIVRAIIALAPKVDKRDLAGQVFQTLIPLTIRKPLGAHYTNPRAADLLASLAITSSDEKVMDLACGSGTLLVASYHRKMALLPSSQHNQYVHKRFIEKEITGFDAMAFASHLAAVNLALQEPLMKTNHVRIGIIDSTTLKPGQTFKRVEKTLKSELKDANLDMDFDQINIRKKIKGPVSMSEGSKSQFDIEVVDTVIMNPPFTSWDNMREEYRDYLMKGPFSSSHYKSILYFKPSFQAFFIILADEMLKENGKIASVLPLTTLTARSFHPLIEFLLKNYTIRYVVVGLGKSAFSEDTSLTECLFVAEKKKPDADAQFTLIAVKKPPNNWKKQDITELYKKLIKIDNDSNDFALFKRFPQASLSPKEETLTGLYLSLVKKYEIANRKLRKIYSNSEIPLIPFVELREKTSIEATQGVFSGKRFFSYGPEAMFIYRNEKRAINNTDRLYITKETLNTVYARDRITNKDYKIEKSSLGQTIRRFPYLETIDMNNETDMYFKNLDSPSFKEILLDIYGEKDTIKILKMLKKVDRSKEIHWNNMIRRGSTKIFITRRANLAAPGTRLLSVKTKETSLAIRDYMLRGFTNEIEEKLFCMWLNSTVFLVEMLSRSTITQGTWLLFDLFAMDNVHFPDLTTLNKDQIEIINKGYEKIKKMKFSPLIEQLEKHHSTRMVLDDIILKLLGIKNGSERVKTSIKLQNGVAEAIRTLQKTMILETEDEE